MHVTWNYSLVFLSILVAMIGSFTALTHAQRMRLSSGRAATLWMIAGSITLGMAVWSMHFIGMLAFHLPIPIAYDLPLTFLSVLPVILATLLGFRVLRETRISSRRIFISGLLMGAGISAMHYTGMAALKMSPDISYNPLAFTLSLVIAAIASWGALLMMYQGERVQLPTLLRFVLGAVIMGTAISGMHYTSLLGITIQPGSMCRASDLRIEPNLLAMLVSMTSLLWFGGGMLATLFDQRMVRQNSLALEQLQAVHAALEQRAQQMATEMTRELREKKGMLNLILDTVPQAIFWKDNHSVYLGCNRVFARDAGLKHPNDIIGKTDFDLPWTPEESAAYRADDQEVISHNTPKIHIIEQQHNADGAHFWLDTSKAPLADNEVFGVLGIYENITERKRLEEERRIAAITFETQEAILITDASATIMRVNQAFQDITGYSAEEVIGKNPRILQSGRHDPAFYQAMWDVLHHTGKWSGEIWDKRKNGEIYPKSITITAVYDDRQQVSNYVAVFTDISLRKRSEDEIRNLAFYDPLTQLPNRRLMMDRLQQAMSISMRSGLHGALIFLDLDHFKNINDTLGHAMGDLLLIEVANRLKACVREGDTVSRLGGDEFVVVLEELSSQLDEVATQSELVAEKIRFRLSQPYDLNHHEYHTTPSIGISLFRDHLENVEELLKHADVAMYQAKMAGRNAIRFFDPKMQTALEVRAALETDLRHALEKRELRLYYQIQVDNLHRPLGAEVLLRWEHPERGFVFPDQFIPLAEETGLILPIGLWVLQTACAQLKAWEHNAQTRDLTVAVNVSARQFHQAGFVDQIKGVLQESGAKPSLLKLELTESIVLKDIEDTISKMHEIIMLGVRFSMDDFGTGYSSLAYLKRLPLDQIKIDKSFVLDITKDPNDAAIVRATIAMSQALGLDVIAEGVETEAQREFLDHHGCRSYQGYLFSKPVPLEHFETLLKSPITTP